MKGIVALRGQIFWLVILGLGLLLTLPERVSAHCDTMAGPVIQEAKTALEKGDVTHAFFHGEKAPLPLQAYVVIAVGNCGLYTGP